MSSALGLGGYGSSDDEDDTVTPINNANQAVANETIGEALSEVVSVKSQHISSDASRRTETATASISAPAPASSVTSASDPALGPAAGPSLGPTAIPDESTNNLPDAANGQDSTAPPSPYTASRMLVRNLTMPPLPNFDIPPSPPGSPPPATTAKFSRFLDLKKKGSHFNDRLNHSSALRNPGLLPKLMEFAGMTPEDQYAVPWSKENANAVPTKFPDWAYADKLVAAHDKIAKKKEQERTKVQREAVDFVPAKQESSTSGSGRVERRAEGKKRRFDE